MDNEYKFKISRIIENRPIQLNWAIGFLDIGFFVSLINFVFILPFAGGTTVLFIKAPAVFFPFIIGAITIKAFIAIAFLVVVYFVFNGNRISRIFLTIIFVGNVVFDSFILMLGNLKTIAHYFSLSDLLLLIFLLLSIAGCILFFINPAKNWFRNLNLIKKGKSESLQKKPAKENLKVLKRKH